MMINAFFLPVFATFLFPKFLARKKPFEIFIVSGLFFVAQFYIALQHSPGKEIAMTLLNFLLGIIGRIFFYVYAKKKGVFQEGSLQKGG